MPFVQLGLFIYTLLLCQESEERCSQSQLLCGIVLLHCQIEMDIILMSGIVCLLAQEIAGWERERATRSANKNTVAKGYS